MDTDLPSSDHSLLVLPFTRQLLQLQSPNPFLPLIYRTATTTLRSLTVLFTTPAPPTPLADGAFSSRTTQPASQLYVKLRNNPSASVVKLQAFLSQVYATLAAGQWSAGRALMDVEVHFGGEDGGWETRLLQREGLTVLMLEGYEDLPLPFKLISLKPTIIPNPSSLTFQSRVSDHNTSQEVDSPAPPVVALGGTFDHLHAAHKLLLHLALFLATRKLIVGVMSSDQLASKSNAQLVESLEERVRGVEEFLVRCGAVKGREARDDEDAKQDVGDEHRDAGRVVMDVVEINDPLGPTAWDPDIQALVVSRETISGGEFVNRKRREEGLSELELFVIDVISSDLDHGDGSEMVEGVVRDLRDVTSESRLKEVKMGSTAIRQWIKDHEPGMTR